METPKGPGQNPTPVKPQQVPTPADIAISLEQIPIGKEEQKVEEGFGVGNEPFAAAVDGAAGAQDRDGDDAPDVDKHDDEEYKEPFDQDGHPTPQGDQVDEDPNDQNIEENNDRALANDDGSDSGDSYFNPQDQMDLFAEDDQGLKLGFENLIPDAVLQESSINLDCPKCLTFILPNPAGFDDWKPAQECLTCHKATCADCMKDGERCNVCDSAEGFLPKLSAEFNAVLEKLRFRCPACEEENTYRDALCHLAMHKPSQDAGQTVFPVEEEKENECCAKLRAEVTRLQEALKEVGLFLAKRTMHFANIQIRIQKNFSWVIDAIKKAKMKEVPFSDINSIKIRHGRFYRENRDLRTKFSHTQIIESFLYNDEDELVQIREKMEKERVEWEKTREALTKLVPNKKDMVELKEWIENKQTDNHLLAQMKNGAKKPPAASAAPSKQAGVSNQQAANASQNKPQAASQQQKAGSQLPNSQARPQSALQKQQQPKVEHSAQEASKQEEKHQSKTKTKLLGFIPIRIGKKPSICPNGHTINTEPLKDYEELKAIHSLIEKKNKLKPGSILFSSSFVCGGPSCKKGNATPLRQSNSGWHLCSERRELKCDYHMVCHRCYKAGSRGYT